MNKCVYSIIEYISKITKKDGVVLEIGSKMYDCFNLRKIFKGQYIGIDFQSGDGVDIVANSHDFKHDFKFDTIICSSILEHDNNPEATIKNIKGLLKENGICIITVPFNHPIHGYPDDYWRFTPEGLKILIGKYFNNFQTFGIGKKRFPHTVIGIINKKLNDCDIVYLNKKWPDSRGLLYSILSLVIPKGVFCLVKYLKYRRFY